MHDLTASLPRSVAEIERRIGEGTTPGVQLAVSYQRHVLDGAWGMARPEQAMTRDSIVHWASSTKVLTAVAVGQVWERGLIDLDDRVTKYIPEFGQNGKEDVTLRHLLTHTSGIKDISPPFWFTHTWDEVLDAICARGIKEDWDRQRHASYGGSGIQILAEVVSRVDDRPAPVYYREAILSPLDMHNCFLGMTAEQCGRLHERMTMRFQIVDGKPAFTPYVDSQAEASRFNAAGGGRGPMREFVHVYEMLVNKGERQGVRLLRPQTVEALTARHRVGRVVDVFQTVLDLGLIVYVDAKHYGGERQQARYGAHASPRAFGHGGAGGNLAFGDPEYGLAAAIYAPSPGADAVGSAAAYALATTIYEDLAVASSHTAPARPPEPAEQRCRRYSHRTRDNGGIVMTIGLGRLVSPHVKYSLPQPLPQPSRELPSSDRDTRAGAGRWRVPGTRISGSVHSPTLSICAFPADMTPRRPHVLQADESLGHARKRTLHYVSPKSDCLAVTGFEHVRFLGT